MTSFNDFFDGFLNFSAPKEGLFKQFNLFHTF